MDYSKYYLKNYEENQEDINYQNGLYEYYKQERDLSKQLSQVIYVSENVAQPDNQEEACVILENTPAVKPKTNKRGRASTVIIIICMVLVASLTTLVISDYITHGSVLSTISNMVNNSVTEYYLEYDEYYYDIDQAKIYGSEQRLKGNAGLIYIVQDKYYIIKNAVTEKSEKSLKITVEAVSLDNFPKELKKSLKGKANICNSLYDKLDKIETGFKSSNLSLEVAKEELKSVQEWFVSEYESLQAVCNSFADDESVIKLLSKYEGINGVITNLLDDELSRPNLICDIIYSKIQILLIK